MNGEQIRPLGVQPIAINTMKKIFVVLMLCLAIVGQAQDPINQKAYIEVTGTAETEVVPDEIYLAITLLERMEGKDKITIEKQEADLKKHLKDLAIDLTNLSLQSAMADYGSVRKKTKDVLISKSYILKLSTTAQLSKVYERLDQMNAQDAYISRFAYSKITELQKENRIKAIKAAKEKAEYLLAAIGQLSGMPLQVTETENFVEGDNNYYAQPRAMRLMANSMESAGVSSEQSMDFKKIKVRNAFTVRFEILKR